MNTSSQKTNPSNPSEEDLIQSNIFDEISSFDELDLKPDLVRGIYGYGFTRPSPIQAKAIRPMIQGKDTIAQAQTGTGKTGAYAISALQLIDEKSLNTQVIILANTKELADQIYKVTLCLGEFLNAKVMLCCGGTSTGENAKQLRDGVHIVVGTPGRVKDLIINRKVLKTDHLKLFILDEADEMLGRGFLNEIQDIVKSIPGDTQIGLVSATMSPDTLKLTQEFMRNPAVILVKKEELTLDNISQYYIAIDKEEWKYETLAELYKNIDIQQCIIYCNRKETVNAITKKLKDQNFTVSSIHGDMTSDERMLIMKEFKSGSSRVLVSSDLLARGIDVLAVSLIINYDLPTKRETYIHRIGRTGRGGRKGVAINFVTPQDSNFLQDVEKYYSTEINELPVELDKVFNSE
jgi:translation initiation factor 4A